MLGREPLFTRLRRSSLGPLLWPGAADLPDIATAAGRARFREREIRRELLGSIARLGHTGVDLWLAVAHQLVGALLVAAFVWGAHVLGRVRT